MTRPRLLLADRRHIRSQTLRTAVEEAFDVVGIVDNAESLRDSANELAPDVIAADIATPNLELIESLVGRGEDGRRAKIVLLMERCDEDDPHPVRYRVAVAIVDEPSSPDEFVAALRAETIAHDPSTRPSYSRRAGEDGDLGLTPRQREVLKLLAQGDSVRKIAVALSISTRTVESHKYQMMETLRLRTTAELVHFAIRSGIVKI